MKLFNQLNADQLKYLDKLLSKAEATVTDTYRAALIELKAEMMDLATRYGLKGMLTQSEMNRFNRYSTMMNSLRGKIADSMGKAHSEMKKTVAETYLESRARTAYAMDMTAGGPLGFGRIDEKDLAKAINDKYSKLADSKALGADKERAFARVKNEINLSMAKGEDVGSTSRRVAEALGFRDKDGEITPNGRGELYKSMRIARTETHRVQSQGQLDAFQDAKDLGVDVEIVWDAALDDRTRDTHGDMDGQVADENGEFALPGGGKTRGPGLSGIAEEDINCRCVARMQVKGFPPSVRRVGDGVEPWQNYKEWKDGLVKGAVTPPATPERAPDQAPVKNIPPVSVFEEQKTVKEAEVWALSQGLADFVSYKGAHIEVANAWNKSVSEHLQSFPELKNNFKFIGTTQERQRKFVELSLEDMKLAQASQYNAAVAAYGQAYYDAFLKKKLRSVAGKTSSNTYAYANYDKFTKGVQVNNVWASSPEKFKTALGKDVLAGFHPVGCDTIKSVIDHEIGHQLDKLLGIGNTTEIHKILKGRDIGKELSRYALRNIKEVIAEAWAEYKNNPNPRQLCLEIARLIEREYNLKYGKT